MSYVHEWRLALVLGFFALAGCGSAPTTPRGVADGQGDVSLIGFDVGFIDAGDASDGEASGTSDGGDDEVSGTSDAGDGGEVSGTGDGSVASDATACEGGCDDGVPCTVDVCQGGTCTHNIGAGACYADGQCFFAGPHPGDPCRVCDPTKGALGLQPAAAGKACDDGSACTTGDACDGAGACLGAPAAGCCKGDLDCVSTDPCVSGYCDVGTGSCASKAKAGCCKGGVCCDVGSGAVAPTGTACGGVALALEWACDGATIKKRETLPGCDGKGADGCSASVALGVVGPWQVVKSCDKGQACVPAALGGGEPSCGLPPACAKADDCNDGNHCTEDSCTAGACVHPPAKAGFPCGNEVIATEYSCSSADPGGKILARKAISTCDGSATQCPATTKAPYWGPWAPIKTCGFNEVCKVADPSQPGVCAGAPKCKPGSTCCSAAGDYAAKGTACGVEVLDSEWQCVGAPPGNKVQARTAVAGCSGSSTTCFTYSASYWVWSPWQDAQVCGAKESCAIGFDGAGSCTSKTQCAPSSGCCSKDGFYQAKGTTCATATPGGADQEESCESSAKGGWILERSATYGCSGQASGCSYASADLQWGAWTKKEQCKPNQVCDDSFGYVFCSDAGVCSPSSGCCSDAGEYDKQGGKCSTSSTAWDTERKCDGSEILQRKGWAGCSGKSGSCSYAEADLVWDPWILEQDCGPKQICKGSGSFFYCGAP